MFDNAYVWMDRQKLLIAYEKKRKEVVADLAEFKQERIELMMSTPCRITPRWFRKDLRRPLTLEEANEKWDNNWNTNITPEGSYRGGPDAERPHYERRVKRFLRRTEILIALDKEEIFISLAEVELIKDYI